MRIEYLKDFVILAKHANFLTASDELYISQSSLSKHIQALEKELGVQLFNRSTRDVRLSSYGQMYLPYAQKMVNNYEKSLMKLNQVKDNSQQTITIGSVPIMASYGITRAIMTFRKKFPRSKVHVVEGDTQPLITLLDHEECDVAFIRSYHQISDDFNVVDFATDRLVAVLPSNHPLAKNTSLKLKELAQEAFLFLKPGSFMYNLSVDTCHLAGFEPIIAYTGKRAENILDLVKEGMGVSLLMEKPVLFLNHKNLSLVPVTPAVQSDIKLVYPSNRKISNITKSFINFIIETT